MADDLGVKRGKLAAYEYESADAKPDFYQLLAKKYHIDINKFLTVVMNDDNYLSFFTTNSIADSLAEEGLTQANEDPGSYKKVTMSGLLNEIRKENDPEIRSRLIDRITIMIGRLEDEKDEVKNELLDFVRMAKRL